MLQTEYITDFVKTSSVPQILNASKAEYIIDKHLKSHYIPYGRVIPAKFAQFNWNIYGGVLFENGEFCEDSAFCEGMQGKIEYAETDFVFDDSKVIFCGNFYNCWGHVLTDDIKRLWFLNTDEGKALIRDGYKLVYISPDNIETCKNAFRLFELAGVDTGLLIRVRRPTVFSEVVVPQSSYIKYDDTHKCTKEYIDTLAEIKRRVSLLPVTVRYDKVYLTRVAFKNTKDNGEKVIEDLFRAKGYTIISPEALTLEDQISMLMNTPEIAMTEGSISHNILFCSPGTKIIILRKVDYNNRYQFLINSLAKSTIIYIDAHHSVMAKKDAPNEGPFFMSVTPQLLSFMGEPVKAKPYWLSKDFFKYVLLNFAPVRYAKLLMPFLNNPISEQRKIISNKIRKILGC